MLSLGYLIVFGSIIAFAAYVYLLKVSTPARVGSYAYVNPVVAVFLGWALADEPVTVRTLAAAAVIITGVILIVTRRQPPSPRDVPPPDAAVAAESLPNFGASREYP